MDEEASFANLLSQSTIAAKPSFYAPPVPSDEHDPWANPFSDTPTSNPFASASPFAPLHSQLEEPREEVSPYVQKLEQDVDDGIGKLPDPPSVIAAREYEAISENAYASNPFAPAETFVPALPEYVAPEPSPPPVPSAAAAPVTRILPSGLIDEDILGASDPSVSLKKAFVKSSTSGRNLASVSEGKAKQYVFKPGGKNHGEEKKRSKVEDDKEVSSTTVNGTSAVESSAEMGEATSEAGKTEIEDSPVLEANVKKEPEGESTEEDETEATAPAAVPANIKPTSESEPVDPSPAPVSAKDESSQYSDTTPNGESSLDEPPHLAASAVPLPDSTAPTPTPTRPVSPTPPTTADPERNHISTPSFDRVAVSPLDAPTSTDYGFKALSIGGSAMDTPPPPPTKSPVSSTWASEKPTSASRFGGRGWGALDEDEENEGLFGKGGPSLKSDPWAGGGWGGESTPARAGPSRQVSEADSVTTISSPPRQSHLETPSAPSTSANGTPRTPGSARSNIRNTPVFQIAVTDPTKIGDPVRGHIIYTVRTRTTSPHYRRGEFSALRRFSDFLWLFEALTLNNPGVIVPPVPDKHAFGRFQDTFVETRRAALQKSLGKIANHPVLQLDPDLRMFLESDSFAMDAKNRRLEIAPEKQSILAAWTGPRYVEQDDWFDSRKTFLDNLESQLKSLSKSIEVASKSRLDMAISLSDFADSVSGLAESDLGSGMCSALARLADLTRREKENQEEQAKDDVVQLLNMADEYVRLIGSVRLAFASRIKAYHTWQNLEKEVARLQSVRERMRQSGKLGDKSASSLAEVGDAERRSRDSSADFENISKLIKSEFVRFERERVEEFKKVLEKHLDQQIAKQKELVEAWEEYHGVVLKMVQQTGGA
ncbi:sorting nexin-1/2, partial [Tremellales sp. Uapishka_1]